MPETDVSVFCSTVIPTIGRPSLDRAVLSVVDQGFIGKDHLRAGEA